MSLLPLTLLWSWIIGALHSSTAMVLFCAGSAAEPPLVPLTPTVVAVTVAAKLLGACGAREQPGPAAASGPRAAGRR